MSYAKSYALAYLHLISSFERSQLERYANLHDQHAQMLSVRLAQTKRADLAFDLGWPGDTLWSISPERSPRRQTHKYFSGCVWGEIKGGGNSKELKPTLPGINPFQFWTQYFTLYSSEINTTPNACRDHLIQSHFQTSSNGKFLNPPPKRMRISPVKSSPWGKSWPQLSFCFPEFCLTAFSNVNSKL